MGHKEKIRLKSILEKKYKRNASTLMILGTTSGAGKSLLVTALCRIFSNEGYNVAPYKSQNMSLNSFVTEDGEEIARIQDLQAKASRQQPKGYMNPILLKPKHDDVSQVMLYGKAYKDMDVKTYYSSFTLFKGLEVVQESLSTIKRLHDVVIIEGAGSPTEINMMDVDIANMKTAHEADAPCLLVVNMEWGGAFAYAYGTLALLSEKDRNRFKGIIFNNMAGDPACLDSGIKELEERLQVPVLGVIPHMELSLPQEDSMQLQKRKGQGEKIIGILRLPRISNFTDFDALELENGVSLLYITHPMQIHDIDALIIPGTKNTIGDLAWIKKNGFDKEIEKIHSLIPIVGICGGYQILGKWINDKNNIESEEECEVKGLGLLDCSTSFDKYEKLTKQVTGSLAIGNVKGHIRGYEIHMGTTVDFSSSPLCIISDENGTRDEGACNESTMVFGTYLHGIFDLAPFRKHLMMLIQKNDSYEKKLFEIDYDSIIEDEIEKLACKVQSHLDMKKIHSIMGVGECDE